MESRSVNEPTIKRCEQCGGVKEISYQVSVLPDAPPGVASHSLSLCFGHAEPARYFPELFSGGDGRTMQEMVLHALWTDECHHKQWYLWRIAEALKIDTSEIIDDADKGISP
jgi:hypothetical protein